MSHVAAVDESSAPEDAGVRILHLEDDAGDAEMVQFKLQEEGFKCSIRRVDNAKAFISELSGQPYDLVLSDFCLPGFDGISALEMVRQRWPETPFILVSGTLGEEVAIESVRKGATDYVLKGRLGRLAPAVRRAMDESASRRARHSLELQFIEAQKMEVVGHLAGGVAHDFNNIIGVIMGYCDLVNQQLRPGDPVRDKIDTIRHAAERAAGLTRQLLIFSRRQAVQPVILNLDQALSELDKMLRRLIDENISLTVSHQEKIWSIRADSGQVGQVLMNLVVNARDAMQHGGELHIWTRNVTVPVGGGGSQRVIPAGDFVVLAVRDTGTGMSEEVKARIFEAFFTTKPKGKGTGLGLATCQTIIKQCNGHIDVHSELGKGTTFEVYFPRVDLPADPILLPVSSASLPGGHETVLLVEDDPAVRQLACDVLEGKGYRVLRAGNGEEGLRVAREIKGQPLSLVITDVVMPQMSGKVMAEWLKTTHPLVKVLFTSGYTDDAITHHGVVEDGVAFLPKPYTPSALAAKARELLDAANR